MLVTSRAYMVDERRREPFETQRAITVGARCPISYGVSERLPRPPAR